MHFMHEINNYFLVSFICPFVEFVLSTYKSIYHIDFWIPSKSRIVSNCGPPYFFNHKIC